MLLDQLTESAPADSDRAVVRQSRRAPASSESESAPDSAAVFGDQDVDRFLRLAGGQATTDVDRRSLNDSLINHGWTDALPYYSPMPPESTTGPPHLGASPSSANLPRSPPNRQIWDVSDSESTAQESGTPPTTSIITQPSPPNEDEEDEAVLDILKSVKSLSSKQRRSLLRHIRHRSLIYADEPEHHIEPRPQTLSARPLPSGKQWVTTQPTSGPPRNRLHYEARRFANFVDRYVTGNMAPAQLSRIYVIEAGFFGALFANCYALGMNDLNAMTQDEGISPFSIDQDTGYHLSQLPVMRAKFSSITPDLAPCDVQITVGHHPYLDVLPFKTFRENAVKLLNDDEAPLDEDSLCADLTGGGLVCWGSQQNSLGMEAGVPWDMRAWEPTVWFLQKYPHLVGGWDDDMWKCTRWWHQARGEKLKLG